MASDIGIVIVTYNSVRAINDLLDSIPAALGRLQSDIVVVDNGSTDGTANLLIGRDDCCLIKSTNDGYAAGVNRGVEALDTNSAILVLNPDLRLFPRSIQFMFEALQHRQTGIVAPRVVGSDGSLQLSLRREPSLCRTLGLTSTRLALFAEQLSRPVEYQTTRIVDWAVGAALLISRPCWDAMVGWDESFFLYSEETDFCLRARDAGFQTRFEPAATVTHAGGGSGRSTTTHVMQVLNRVRLYRRRHGRVCSTIYMFLVAAREAKSLLRGDRRHAAAIVALVRPARRPNQLHCSDKLLPG